MDDERFSIVDVEEEPGSQETIREHVLAEKQATAFVSLGGQLYQLVVVPLSSPPQPAAWIAAGIRIDDAMAQEMRNLALLSDSLPKISLLPNVDYGKKIEALQRVIREIEIRREKEIEKEDEELLFLFT